MDQHDLETGVEIGDFRVEQRLGAGGMGIVYRARQVSLDRVVALKILGAALNREASRSRFQREAQAVAKLSHPGIAGVHYIGQDRHVCYMAMEFVDGLSLREVIDRLSSSRDTALTIDLALQAARSEESEGTLEVRFDQPTADLPARSAPLSDGDAAGPDGPTPEAMRLVTYRTYMKRCCEVAIETAEALAHAHDRGVVHRDVKPENILIDRQGHVHLIDFGVARFFEDNSLTNTGALVGTPMYMSPEQVTGRIDLDPRTDVYSLGLVLYELLTLARPIASTTREGILRQVVTKAMPPASWRNPALPRDLEGVLHKAAAKDPDDRYQTAVDFAADLRRWLDDQPVAAFPYRYRLDRREIKAERPAGITFLSFVHFMASAMFAFLAVNFFIFGVWAGAAIENAMRARGMDEPMLQGVRKSMIVIPVVSVLIAAYSLYVGFGLLAAHRWARRVSVAVFTTLATWRLHDAVLAFLHGNLILVAVNTVVVACAVSAVAYLLCRSTRTWFRLAARLQAEHGR